MKGDARKMIQMNFIQASGLSLTKTAWRLSGKMKFKGLFWKNKSCGKVLKMRRWSSSRLSNSKNRPTSARSSQEIKTGLWAPVLVRRPRVKLLLNVSNIQSITDKNTSSNFRFLVIKSWHSDQLCTRKFISLGLSQLFQQQGQLSIQQTQNNRMKLFRHSCTRPRQAPKIKKLLNLNLDKILTYKNFYCHPVP